MKTIFLDKIHIGDSIRKVLAEKDAVQRLG